MGVTRSLDNLNSDQLSEATGELRNLVEGVVNRAVPRASQRLTIRQYLNRPRYLVPTVYTTFRVYSPYPMQFNVKRGLTNQRVEKFDHFALDESTVGYKCLVCQDNPVIGTRMMRLDCHVDHVFCEQCAVPWFESHNTCPTCRQAFS